MVSESTPLRSVLGGRTAGPLAASRGLRSVGDLLGFWPRRYRSRESDLAEAKAGRYLVAVAEVKTATTNRMRNGRSMLKVVITDGTTDLSMVFFSVFGHERALQPGVRGIFAGTVTSFNRELQLTHPGYTVLDEIDSGERSDLIPIYLHVPRMHTWKVTESVRLVLDALTDMPDDLPPDLVARHHLVTRLEAFRGIHTPKALSEVERARHRLRYEEALVLQLALAQRRARARAEVTTARTPRPDGILAAFDERLPFELTHGQQVVGEDIAADLAASTPMHRLLQGEVGSGKTVVALRAMLAVVDSGGQAALLAPTEVLAAQHHRTMTAMLGDLASGGYLGGDDRATRVTLLTGSQSAAERRAALRDIESGEAGIVVGTHALIQDAVTFHDLALVVVDEQHRFGVEQRDALRGKALSPPHVLVMTATPIPRTVAMTVFGDLEVSTLRELPAGRAPIETFVIPDLLPGWLERVWQRIGAEVAAGHQVFVVCPRIHDDAPPDPGTELWTEPPDEDGLDLDNLGDGGDEGKGGPGGGAGAAGTAAPQPAQRPLRSVESVAAELRAHPALTGVRLGILHGALPSVDKDAVMDAFARGDLDVLVATTVIEVGVDVPKATFMVVMDADRFGVSQLHQLRGRVGRGGLPGTCALVTGSDSPMVRERLEAVKSSTDGFVLARLDLDQRREGDILGATQHGRRTQLEFLHILEHEDLIEAARADARALVDEDPELARLPRLAAAVAARVDADQAAYLERG